MAFSKVRFSMLLSTAAASAFAAMACGLVGIQAAHAASITWNSAGTSWNNAANWTPNQVPGSGDTAVFDSTRLC